MAGKVSGSSNRSQSQSSNSSISSSKSNSSTKTRGGHVSEGHSGRVRHRSPHGGHHHHAHSPHMEDIQKAELAARQEEQTKVGNGERSSLYSRRKKDDH